MIGVAFSSASTSVSSGGVEAPSSSLSELSSRIDLVLLKSSARSVLSRFD